MADKGIRELYIDELRDLYSAENQLIKALPKMAKASSSEELRQGFEEHLEQTKGHVQRLEEIFEALNESPKGKKCAGMEGLIQEGSEAMQEDFEGSVMDAALIGAARRVEHYEMAAYATVHALAEALNEDDHAELLEATLEEEKETDDKLTELGSAILQEALNSDQEDENPSQDDTPASERATKTGKKRTGRAA